MRVPGNGELPGRAFSPKTEYTASDVLTTGAECRFCSRVIDVIPGGEWAGSWVPIWEFVTAFGQRPGMTEAIQRVLTLAWKGDRDSGRFLDRADKRGNRQKVLRNVNRARNGSVGWVTRPKAGAAVGAIW